MIKFTIFMDDPIHYVGVDIAGRYGLCIMWYVTPQKKYQLKSCPLPTINHDISISLLQNSKNQNGLEKLNIMIHGGLHIIQGGN